MFGDGLQANVLLRILHIGYPRTILARYWRTDFDARRVYVTQSW